MDKLFLKEFVYQYILLHDNLTKDEKLQIGTFVKEASEEQVMALLLCGECKEKLEEGEGEFVRNLFEASPVGHIITEVDFEKLVTKGGVAIAKGDSALWVRNLASKFASVVVPTKELPGGIKLTSNLGAWNSSYGEALKAIKVGTPVAAFVMASLILLVARKVYKAYLTKAAKACKGQATTQLKNECIRRFKINAIKEEVKQLEINKKACDSTKNPERCRSKVDSRIAKCKSKITKVMSVKKPR